MPLVYVAGNFGAIHPKPKQFGMDPEIRQVFFFGMATVPVVALLFTVPIPDPLENEIVWALQRLAAGRAAFGRLPSTARHGQRRPARRFRGDAGPGVVVRRSRTAGR